MTQMNQLSQGLVVDLLAAITQRNPPKHALSPRQIAAQLLTALESSWGPDTFQEKMNDARARLEVKAKAAEQEEILDGFLKALDGAASVGKSLKEEATGRQHQDCTATTTPKCEANTRKRKRDLCDELDQKVEELNSLRKKLRTGFVVDAGEAPARDQEEKPPVYEDSALMISQFNEGFEYRTPGPHSQAADHHSSQEHTVGCETRAMRSCTQCSSPHRRRTPSTPRLSASRAILSPRLMSRSTFTRPRKINATAKDHAAGWEHVDADDEDEDEDEDEEEEGRLQPYTPPGLTSRGPSTFPTTGGAQTRPSSAKRVLLRRREKAQPQLTRRFIAEMDRRLVSSGDKASRSSGTLRDSECWNVCPADDELDRGSEYGKQEQTQRARAAANVDATVIKLEPGC